MSTCVSSFCDVSVNKKGYLVVSCSLGSCAMVTVMLILSSCNKVCRDCLPDVLNMILI